MGRAGARRGGIRGGIRGKERKWWRVCDHSDQYGTVRPTRGVWHVLRTCRVLRLVSACVPKRVLIAGTYVCDEFGTLKGAVRRVILFTLSDDLTCKGWDVTIVPEDKSETVRLEQLYSLSRDKWVPLALTISCYRRLYCNVIIRTLRPLSVPISDRVEAPPISCYC
jgi:hypothetical protein